MRSQQVGRWLTQVRMAAGSASRLRRLKMSAARTLCAGLLIAAVLAAATAPSFASEDPVGSGTSATKEATFDDARWARAEGDFATAIAILERLLSDNPNDVDALVQLGFVRLALDDTISAEQAFTKTLRLAPDYVDATLGVAYVAFRRSEFKQAERFAAAVLEAAPDYKGARTVLEAAKAAQENARPVKGSRPPPRPLEITPANGAVVGPEIIAPDLKVTPRPERRRAFLSIGSRLGSRRDFNLYHALEIRKTGGPTLVFGLRHTSRENGDAIQLRFSAFKPAGEIVYGLEFGLGQGADNLARALVGGSVEFPVAENVAFHSRLWFKKFAQSEVVSLASRLTKTAASGGAFSLGLTSSAASNVRGLATVIDARAALPLSDSSTLRLGVAYGEELDGPRMRDLRSIAIGLAHDINDDLTIIGTVTSEPGSRWVGLTFARRF